MMRKLPDCPRCEDEILTLIRNITWTTVRCLECGWSHTFMPPLDESEIDTAIARVVQSALPPSAGHCLE